MIRSLKKKLFFYFSLWRQPKIGFPVWTSGRSCNRFFFEGHLSVHNHVLYSLPCMHQHGKKQKKANIVHSSLPPYCSFSQQKKLFLRVKKNVLTKRQKNTTTYFLDATYISRLVQTLRIMKFHDFLWNLHMKSSYMKSSVFIFYPFFINILLGSDTFLSFQILIHKKLKRRML